MSLSEYRNRRKDKSGSSVGVCSSTSSRSSSYDALSSHRSSIDCGISLAPLPLFEPVTLTKEKGKTNLIRLKAYYLFKSLWINNKTGQLRHYFEQLTNFGCLPDIFHNLSLF